jgi:hypothetical protein
MLNTFRKYLHVERMCTPGVEGLFDEPCLIQIKLDGSNGSIWMRDGMLEWGSRNFDLGRDPEANQGFGKWVIENRYALQDFFFEYPNHILYGEWLVKHTISGYVDEAWRKFYAFDAVDCGTGFYSLEWKKIREKLLRLGLPTVPEVGHSHDGLNIKELLESCTDLLKPGAKHEGLVFKRPGFINKFGHVAWAKYVPEPLMKKKKAPEGPLEALEQRIVDEFCTPLLIEKEIAKILVAEDLKAREPKLIPKVMGIVWYTFVTEEIWNILKKHKMPTVNFHVLQRLVQEKVREAFAVAAAPDVLLERGV